MTKSYSVVTISVLLDSLASAADFVYSNRGECTVAKIDAWSADEIVVNHLREGDSWAERYLKCAPVVVSPSRWEGMPYLLMKARALACRILATDCPGNRDVLKGYEKWEVLDL